MISGKRLTPQTAIPMEEGCKGFTLIEVLVAMVLLSIAAMALLSLQGRNLSQIRDLLLHTQSMYLADDMLELLLATPPEERAQLYLWPGQTLGEQSGPVCHDPVSLNCWYGRVGAVLASDGQLLAQHVHVCPSDRAGTCSASADTVEIQLAWRSTGRLCRPFDSEHGVCHYRLRSSLP